MRPDLFCSALAAYSQLLQQAQLKLKFRGIRDLPHLVLEMSPGFGMATARQVTDQPRWERMLAALVREMPGAWEQLTEDVTCACQAQLLQVTEEYNFGDVPGVFVGNWHWQTITKSEDEVDRLLREGRATRYDRESLEIEQQIWQKLPSDLKADIQHVMRQGQESRVPRALQRVPFALELLQGEHPRLPRYARHFRSMESKNVDFTPIVRIMKRFFPLMYDSGYECEEGHDDGVPLANDGSAEPFYAALVGRFTQFAPPARAALTSHAVTAHNARTPSAGSSRVESFLGQKLPAEIVRSTIRELGYRRGFALADYTEEEIAEVCSQVAAGAFRVQLDVGRGLSGIATRDLAWGPVFGQQQMLVKQIRP